MPAIPPLPEAVSVTIPAEIAETSKFVEKLIDDAVPTTLPSCLTIIPEPDAVTPVSAEPSPANLVAVNVPFEELNVRLVPLFGGKFPVAAVVNNGKQVVSEDSSATVTLVEVVAVSAFPVRAPFTPFVADTIPTTIISPVPFVILACVLSCDIFRSLSVQKLATALSANFAANVVVFVPSSTPLVSILVENVPTPLTTKSSKSVRPSTSKSPPRTKLPLISPFPSTSKVSH